MNTWCLDSKTLHPYIYDITVGLSYQKNENLTAAAAYHCMFALSEVSHLPLLKTGLSYPSPSDRLRENGYLHDLLTSRDDCSLSDFLNLDGCFDEAEKGDSAPVKALSFILHQQNLSAFTDYSKSLSIHRKELALRFNRHFYLGRHEIHPSNTKLKLPGCISFIPFDQLSDQRSEDADLSDDYTSQALTWQFASLFSDNLTKNFTLTLSSTIPYTECWPSTL